MVVSPKPELEKLVAEKVKAGWDPSAEALMNSAVAQVMAGDDLEPGEMEAAIAVGEQQARAGRLVDGDATFARLKAKSDARRSAGRGMSMYVLTDEAARMSVPRREL